MSGDQYFQMQVYRRGFDSVYCFQPLTPNWEGKWGTEYYYIVIAPQWDEMGSRKWPRSRKTGRELAGKGA
jgi:hypothetical protein